MAKKKNLMSWISLVVSLFVTLAVGGLFLSGQTLLALPLSWFPEIVHTVVGWIVIVGGVYEFAMRLMK